MEPADPLLADTGGSWSRDLVEDAFAWLERDHGYVSEEWSGGGGHDYVRAGVGTVRVVVVVRGLDGERMSGHVGVVLRSPGARPATHLDEALAARGEPVLGEEVRCRDRAGFASALARRADALRRIAADGSLDDPAAFAGLLRPIP